MCNDNAYSEALFKTLKYAPSYPSRLVEDVEKAREWVMEFVRWYNLSRRHSNLKYVTPAQRHQGDDQEILEKRKRVYKVAKNRNPQRWSGGIRNWEHESVVHLNPMRDNGEIKAA
jgi:hypothetical protein